MKGFPETQLPWKSQSVALYTAHDRAQGPRERREIKNRRMRERFRGSASAGSVCAYVAKPSNGTMLKGANQLSKRNATKRAPCPGQCFYTLSARFLFFASSNETYRETRVCLFEPKHLASAHQSAALALRSRSRRGRPWMVKIRDESSSRTWARGAKGTTNKSKGEDQITARCVSVGVLQCAHCETLFLSRRFVGCYRPARSER